MSQAVETLSRRERRKLEVRTRILEAAVSLFEERGPGATTVAEICERADVADKTFFNHFVAKQHLIRAIAEDALETLLVDIESVRKEPAPLAVQLRRFFTLIADNALAAGPMQRELVTEIIHAVHESGDEPRQAGRLRHAFEAMMRAAAERGEVTAAHDIQTCTEMVQGAFYVLMFSWANLEGYPLRERALAAADFLADALAPHSREKRA
jgi:AcrR family transcriptional regulator